MRVENNKASTEELTGEVRKIETVMIPYSVLGVIFAIVLQTMGAIWWASGITIKIDFLQKSQQEFTQTIIDGTRNRYTSLDASRDWALNEKRIVKVEEDIKLIQNKILDLPPKWFQEKFDDIKRRVEVIEQKTNGK